jgi:membrane-bound metal-dependent hydrolase YbcI (DUF457 family)
MAGPWLLWYKSSKSGLMVLIALLCILFADYLTTLSSNINYKASNEKKISE